MMTVQRCPRCERDLDPEAFTPSNRHRRGTWCRDCYSQYNRLRYGPLKCVDCEQPYERADRRVRRCPSCVEAQRERTARRRQQRGLGPEPKALGYRRSKDYKAECAVAQRGCALCGLPIDYALEFPDRMSFSVDHIIPLGRGGAVIDQTNLQPSHLSCNARRGRLEQGEPLLLARAALWLRDAMREVTHDRHARAQG